MITSDFNETRTETWAYKTTTMRKETKTMTWKMGLQMVLKPWHVSKHEISGVCINVNFAQSDGTIKTKF